MRRKTYLPTILFASSMLLLAIFMMRFPKLVYTSSLQGLKIWWDVVFPSTFPIMILSELMVGVGIVHFLGVLLEPLMRPLFNVPGAGGFAMAMGFSSSYPVGPKLATLLRQQKLVTRAEGERLVCFTSTGDPMFILVAISVGIFHDATLGVVIAAANFLGALLLGFLLRFYARGEKSSAPPKDADQKRPLFLRAIQAMHRAQIEDKRTLGELMRDAVTSTLQTLFAIGAFMMIFSVIINLISTGAFAEIVTAPLAALLSVLHLPTQFSQSLITGFFEVTQSMKRISEVSGSVDMKSKIVIASALVAWGGISVHAQVASIISVTDMRYQPYFLSKIVHAFLAGLLAFFLWEPLRSRGGAPVFSKMAGEAAAGGATNFFYFLAVPVLLTTVFLFLGSLFRYIASKPTKT